MGAHTAPPETKDRRWWRRTLVGVPLWAVMLFAGSLIALAAFLSAQSTGDSSFTTASVGNVDLGTAENASLFGTDVIITPNETLEACFGFDLLASPTTTASDIRLYQTLTDGGLGDDFTLSIDVKDGSGADLDPGCTRYNANAATPANLYSGPITGFASDWASAPLVATGAQFGDTNMWIAKVTITVGASPLSGETLSQALTVEAQPTP